jgi:hypothetical protein
MAMNTVTNYTCDRCGRSEIKDGVTILTMTIRPRAGKGVQGLGKPDVSAHVCRDNCLKIIKASMTPVGIPGQYDRKAAAAKRQAATKSATKSAASPTTARTKVTNKTKAATKGGTKKARTARTSKITPTASATTGNTRADTVRAVRAITRVNGKYAPGYGPAQERAMIAERERAGN